MLQSRPVQSLIHLESALDYILEYLQVIKRGTPWLSGKMLDLESKGH